MGLRPSCLECDLPGTMVLQNEGRGPETVGKGERGKEAFPGYQLRHFHAMPARRQRL